MPELPEVETIRRDLESVLLGDQAVRFDVFDARLIRRRELARWNSALIGQTWNAFKRKGKYLSMELANGWSIGIHLRMTGQLIVTAGRPATGARLLIEFASGKTLGLYDQRRFAEAWLLAPDQSWRESNPLGPDALNELEEGQFVALVKARTTRIQPLLMDQRLMSGVGNIYAQEALFKASIRPTRQGCRLTRHEALRLFEALRDTLLTAIKHRGSSSRNYRDANGAKGSAQTLHAVYRKGGNPCPRCRCLLKSTRVGGRGSVFCPACQK